MAKPKPNKFAATRRIGVHEFRANLTGFLREARVVGQSRFRDA